MPSLAFHPPYDADGLLAFFAARAIPQVEWIEAGLYRRVIRLQHEGTEHLGWLEVKTTSSELHITLSESLQVVQAQLLESVARVFDVNARPEAVLAVLGELAADCPGLRLPGTFDPFELCVRAVLGQQITVKAARTLAQRLVQRFGQTIQTPFSELNLAFPSASTLASCAYSELAELGIIARRSQAIIAIAQAFANGTLDFTGPREPLLERLQAIPGIGPWTANYMVMRGCSDPDRWLPKDIVLLNALNLPRTEAGHKQAQHIATQWAPWRSYAVLHHWRRCT